MATAQAETGEPVNREDDYDEEEVTRLDALSLVLVKVRSEAIDGRALSGIEDEWLEDEEFYEGIDDANRREHRAWRSKPLGQLGLPSEDQGTTSTIFLNITRPYVDAAGAKVGDMLIPTDDKAWSINHTPIPGMKDLSEGNVNTQMRRAIEARYPDNPEQQQQEIQAIVKEAEDLKAEYAEKAEAATVQIEDWHVECQFHAEMRSVIDDTSKSGSGVLKGPVPEKRRQVMYRDGALVIGDDIKPGSRRIDYWNFYPDPGCGENIHDGGYTWERDDITRRKLQNLIGVPDYDEDQILKVLAEGPMKATKEVPERAEELGSGMERDSKHLFEIWYYHGDMEAEDLIDCGCTDEDLKPGTVRPAHVVMVNNHIIKSILNPLDTGEYPYDVMCWQSRKGMPWGMGVARQIRTAQNIVKGACRNMMDNAGRAGGPQVVIKRGVVEPADGIFEVTPWKIWFAAQDADLDHLDNAFRFIVIPMLQQEIEKIILLGLKLAEDTTGLPMLLQGQTGESTPTTLGGQQMMQNNASSVLRRVARLYDDRLTEPHIRRYYVYLLQYGEDDAKGDFQVDARGSSALVERELQSQNIAQLGNLVINPVFGVDPKKWMQEYLKSQRLDYKRFDYDDEEWKQLVEQLANPEQGPDSAIEVAKIRVEMEMMKLQQAGKVKEAEMSVQILEAEKDRSMTMAVEYMKREIEAMRLSGHDKTTLDNIEAKLADTSMKLRGQLKLASMNTGKEITKELIKPPTEPPGKAKTGHSFEQ